MSPKFTVSVANIEEKIDAYFCTHESSTSPTLRLNSISFYESTNTQISHFVGMVLEIEFES